MEIDLKNNIMVYGAGYTAKIVANYLHACLRKKIEAFVVSKGHREMKEYALGCCDEVVPIMEIDELDGLQNTVFFNTLIKGYDDVNEILISKGVRKDCIINAWDDFEMMMDEFCQEYCKYFGIDLSQPVMDCRGVKIVNVMQDQILRYNFWGTFADEIMPAIYHDTTLTVDGPYEMPELGVEVRSGDYVLDIGANLGLFSCYAAQKGCHVYAVDPDERCLEVLRQQQALYPEQIEILPYGLSEDCGTADFYVSESCGISSMCQPRGVEEEITIELETIDHLAESGKIHRIDYLKADIEGAERLMLRGATNVLRTMAPRLSICTYHYKEDPELLESIIKEANPDYVVQHAWRKLYAYVPE